MKAVAKTRREPGVEVIETDPDPVGSGDVQLDIRSASICGSDLGFYNFTAAYQRFAKIPVIMGHEFAGEVSKVGGDVEGFKAGDRVVSESIIYCGACGNCRKGYTNICEKFTVFGMHRNGGFAEHTSLDPRFLHRLPDEVTFLEGGLVEPLSVVINGIDEIGDAKVGESAVVIGPGPLGLLSAEILRCKGLAGISVVGIGVDEPRLEVASKKLGFRTVNSERQNVADLVNELTGGRGADLVVVTAGAAGALRSAVPIVAKGGRIVVLGIFPEEVPLPVSDLVRRQVAILGSYASRWVHYEQAIALLKEKRISAEAIVTHRFPFEKADDAFETARSRTGCKVQFTTQGGS